ncbi:hypothetical protein O9929_10605 [Vibrio lentus]|nr:hypothetical protein [Vibrio lentus]
MKVPKVWVNCQPTSRTVDMFYQRWAPFTLPISNEGNAETTYGIEVLPYLLETAKDSFDIAPSTLIVER